MFCCILYLYSVGNLCCKNIMFYLRFLFYKLYANQLTQDYVISVNMDSSELSGSHSLGYHKCVYKDCTNNCQKCQIDFFRFPVNDTDRCKKWIQACGNPCITNMASEDVFSIRYKVICAEHFDSEYSRDPTAQEKRFNWNAIPRHFTKILSKFYTLIYILFNHEYPFLEILFFHSLTLNVLMYHCTILFHIRLSTRGLRDIHN